MKHLFTAGGNKDAEIATPIRELTLPEASARATPAPDGIATKNLQ